MRTSIVVVFAAAVLSVAISCGGTNNVAQGNGGSTTTSNTKSDVVDQKWWKEAVVYQIYPRSFKDSNGDGVGDLKGIISKLNYIKNLGVDVIWLNPIFASPNDDNGYDISDYQAIMKDFGTMEDFDTLLKGLHDRKIKLVLDLVANHSSDEHRWFQESRKSRDNPYRDYYHWWPAEKGKPNPRKSFFDVNGDAWKFDEPTNSYFLHIFSQKQPDLNWENPKLRQEMYSMMKFWFDKGIDGFRMDVISFISKDTNFPPLPPEYNGDFGRYYSHGPHVHDYIQEMNREVLSKYDIMTVGEIGATPEDAHLFVDSDRNELNMLYNFEGVDFGYLPNSKKIIDPNGWSLVKFKEIYSKWDATFAEKGWGTIYLGNHDQPRMVSRRGDDRPQWRELSSKMLTTFLLTMRGTPYYYFGDELGMSNIKFDNIDDYRDIETINWYKGIQKDGGDLKQFMDSQKIAARDNGRTPFQWDDSTNAGFSGGTPWLKVNPNYTTVNVAAEEKDPNSCLNYFRKMITLRKGTPTLVYGKYTLLDKENESVYAYTRELNGQKLLVLLNFKDHPATVSTGIDLAGAKVLIGNYPDPASKSELRPYESVVYELAK